MASAFYEQIYTLVAQIPEGRVATYGQIASLLGKPRAARQVGYAMAACPRERKLPWHRVINARGEVSKRADPGAGDYQRVALEAEGIVFNALGRVCLADCQWQPG